MSHGTNEDHKKLFETIRGLEKELDRRTTILADLQGPTLRVGKFKGDKALLVKGDTFVLDSEAKPADSTRVNLPHAEIFDAVTDVTRLLIDDGKLLLSVASAGPERLHPLIEVDGQLFNTTSHKATDVLLPAR